MKISINERCIDTIEGGVGSPITEIKKVKRSSDFLDDFEEINPKMPKLTCPTS